MWAFDLLLRLAGPLSAAGFYFVLSQEVAVLLVKGSARPLSELEVVVSVQLPLVESLLLEPLAGQCLWVVGLSDWLLVAGLFAVVCSVAGWKLPMVSGPLSVGEDFAAPVSEPVELGSGLELASAPLELLGVELPPGSVALAFEPPGVTVPGLTVQ